MWTQNSSSATWPIGEVIVTTMIATPPMKHAWRHPGTARGVPARLRTRRV